MRHARQGFTLLEISIVLIIIGLLVGGVMVARDLIRASEINQQTNQIRNYYAATYAFRLKFRGLPGDLTAATAGNYGLATRSGAIGHGDGNGRIEGCSRNAKVAGCENVLFWTDLSDAKLIGGTYVGSDALVKMTAAPPEPGSVDKDTILPRATLSGNYLAAYTDGATNFLQLAGVIATNGLGIYSLENRLTPLDSARIDSKMDDGLPLSGSVKAVGGTTTLGVPAVPALGACVATVTDNPYNTLTSDFVALNLCQLSLRMH